eukprot:CAMPEP_0170589320 /NCGR_PEP_ID=MMETSP0224-20130122/11289_1 /TAXON_ID=285029 /ORGANISM="Togula jolla, Strain CCCM 725" /LENGTH=111 /DNA_ID=CAMNT_0010913073 /DNA_START=315 /DNA_END=651 /DNA_ORIENTATION=+
MVKAADDRDEVVHMERRGRVHREVDGDALITTGRQGRRHKAHQWVISGICRAAEPKASNLDKMICVGSYEGFLGFSAATYRPFREESTYNATWICGEAVANSEGARQLPPT